MWGCGVCGWMGVGVGVGVGGGGRVVGWFVCVCVGGGCVLV